MLPPAGRLGVAVSGGADSVALLHALEELLPDRELCVIHLNHCLRGRESDEDENFVRALAATRGHGFQTRREDVAARAGRRRPNIEAAGRARRHAFFQELLANGVCTAVATGHTRSDQAETVLFRLLRGAGGLGLGGIWPVHDWGLVRPMIDVSRAEVLRYLERRAIHWREDSTNRDDAFARNRLRHSLLPELRSAWNARLDAALARTADWALEEEKYWRLHTAELRRRCTSVSPAGVLLDAGRARALHAAELRRLVRSILAGLGHGPAGTGFEHVEAVRSLVASQRGTGSVDLPGARVERSFTTVRFVAGQAREAPAFHCPLPVPGMVEIPGTDGAVLRTRIVGPADAPTLYNGRDIALLSPERIPGRLSLRSWRPGDRYQPAGMGVSRKLKHLFQQERICSWDRAGWPLVTVARGGSREGRIVWARRFGPAEEFAAGKAARRAVAVDEIGGAE